MWAASPGSQSMNCLPYGLTQCRLLDRGVQRIAGINLANVPGFSVTAKMTYLKQLSKPDVETLVTKTGFANHNTKPNSKHLVVIPSNYLVLTDCPSESKVSKCINC